ncbi:hypothetical protein ACP4OV_008451 [Aristida adscensionis]
MAEQIMNYVTTVVAAGELAGKAFSGMAGNLGKEPELDEKLERLEMMLLKIHSAVEASQNHTIENTSLLHWRVKLKKAAAEGELVLASFRQRAMDGNHQQDGGASSSITTAAAPANQPQNGGASSSNTTAVAPANKQQDGAASSSNTTAVAPANEQPDGVASSSNTTVVAPANQQQDGGSTPSSSNTIVVAPPNQQQDGGDAPSSNTTMAAPANKEHNGGGAPSSNTTAAAPTNQQQDGGTSSSNTTAVAPPNCGASSFSATAVAPANHWEDGGASSSNTTTASPMATTATAMSFTRNALSAMAKGFRSAAKMMSFWSDEDTRKLDVALEKLEKYSSDTKEFVSLLLHEVMLKAQQGSTENTKRIMGVKKRCATGCLFSIKKVVGGLVEAEKAVPVSSTEKEVAEKTVREGERQRQVLIMHRLKRSFHLISICRAVKLADRRNLSGHEWLACWADTLREANAQGTVTIAAISAAGEEIVGCDGQRSVELRIFMHSMESLARSRDFFRSLLRLCPSY